MQPPSEMGLRMRRVMRQWLTGVTILTVRSGDELRGMTCNSFNSVSDNPATVLVSIRRGTRTHEMVAETGRYAISILPAAHQALSDRYAGVQGEAIQSRFDDVPHRASPAGAPWLDGALGWIEARVVQSFDFGGSTLFVAEIEAVEPGDESSAPLARFRSAYSTIPI